MRRIPIGIALFGMAFSVPTHTAAQTRTVTVDDLPVRVRTAGLENRTPGQPVVIFENGASNTIESWEPVLTEVGAFVPYLSYNRSGFGGTAWDSIPPTPEHIASRLHRLLDELEIAPPYVLVGHFWGGRLIHQFAGMYPDEVTGMLYLDPTDFTETPAEARAAFEAVSPDGAGLQFYEQEQAELAAMAEQLRGVLGAGLRILAEHQGSPLDERGLLPQPEVPISVIVANPEAGEIPSGEVLDSFPFDILEYERVSFQARVEKLRYWAQGGEFIIAPTPQHLVHHAEPRLVVDAVRRLVSD